MTFNYKKSIVSLTRHRHNSEKNQASFGFLFKAIFNISCLITRFIAVVDAWYLDRWSLQNIDKVLKAYSNVLEH